MFLTWSSWLRATTLNTMRRNCSSSPPRPSRRNHLHRLLVGVGAGLVEVVVGERPQRLHMELGAVVEPVEAARHEVRLPFSSKRRHSVIVIPAAAPSGVGELDCAEACGSSSSLSLLRETPSNLSSQCWKPGPASTCPERTSFVWGFQAMTALALARRRRFRRSGDRGSPVRVRPPRTRPSRARGSSEPPTQGRRGRRSRCRRWPVEALYAGSNSGAHAPPPDVTEALDRVEASGARPCWQATRRSGRSRIGRAVSRRKGPGGRESSRGSARKSVRLGPQGHDDRRKRDAASRERGAVLEGCDRLSALDRDRSDPASPQVDRGDGHA